MLKLFKYDWRRNSLVFYVTISVLVALNALFHIGLVNWDWNQYGIFTLSILSFLTAGIILFVRNATLFSEHLKSYSRRLLPVSPYQEIGSIAIVQLIYTIVLAILLTLSLYLFSFTLDFMDLEQLKVTIGSTSFMVLTSIYGVWSTINSLLYILFAITVSIIIRFKYRIWTGTAVFIILAIIVTSITDLIMGPSMNLGMRMGTGNSAFYLLFPAQYMSRFIAGFLFEIVAAAIIVYCTAWLMKKKIEL